MRLFSMLKCSDNMNIASLNVVLMSNVNVKKFTLSDYPEVGEAGKYSAEI